MNLVHILCLLIQYLVNLADAETFNNNPDNGLFTSVYNCDTLTNCQHLLLSNTYDKTPHLFSFVQHQNSVSHYTDATLVQDLPVEGSNFIVQKSGYFKRMSLLLILLFPSLTNTNISYYH